jgi:hypothetical protein
MEANSPVLATEQITEPSDSEKVKLYNQKDIEWDPKGEIKKAAGFLG